MTKQAHANGGFAWCLILAGLCFTGRAITAIVTGPPPSTGAEILAWIDGARFIMMLSNEALVIGATLLLIGVFGFQRLFSQMAPMQSIAGTAVFFAAGVVCLVLGIVQGRFVYPIHGIELVRPEDAELLAALYFGGYHLVALAFTLAAVFWSLAMLKTARWRVHGYLGFAVALGSAIGSYPDLIGPVLVFALESALALWWIAIGVGLLRADRVAVESYA